MSKKRGLGRGLDALIPAGKPEGDRLLDLPLKEIRPNARQARQSFDEAAIEELAASIDKHGLVQPVIVRRSSSGYELVAGERRFRAYQQLGKASIPAIVRELGDLEATAALLIENIQRQDLNPLEEAMAYKRLIEDFELTQEEVALQVGKSRAAVANSLRLLAMPPKILELLSAGAIAAGHARAVAILSDDAMKVKLALRAAERGMSVRDVEAEARRWEALQATGIPRRRPDRLLRQWARSISRHLGAGVKIRGTRDEGKIEIQYKNEEELRRIVEGLNLQQNVSRET